MQPRDFADSMMICLMRVFRKSSSKQTSRSILTDYLSRDFVDTEHCTGDLNQVLLGSFIEEFDALDEAIQSPPGTPSRNSSYGTSQSPPESQPPTFAHLAQRTSPQNMVVRSDPPQIYPRISQTHPGNDSGSRRPEKQHTLPSFSYSGH